MTSKPSSTNFKLLLRAVEDNNISKKELVVQLYELLREGAFSVTEMIHHFQEHNPEFQKNVADEDNYGNSCTDEINLTMKEWLTNELYSELIQMPLWTLSAFGYLQSGQVLKQDDVRIQLLTFLIVSHINKCPDRFYDSEYRHNWSVTDFIPCVKTAIHHIKTIERIFPTDPH